MKKKIILCGILGLGVFNVLASVLNRYYNFHDTNTLVFLYWYVAEMGVAMFVGNLPLCWPVLRLIIGSNGESSVPSYQHRYPTLSGRRRKKPKTGLTTLGTLGDETTWDKLEDHDVTIVNDKSQALQSRSDHGSMIELVNQPGRHHAAISSERSSGHMATEAGRSREGGASPEGDRIMVTTTVDIEHGDAKR